MQHVSTKLGGDSVMEVTRCGPLSTILLFALAVSMFGCSGGVSNSPPKASAVDPSPSVAVTVFPATASVQAGNSQQFTATVHGTTNTGVTWSVDNIAGGNTSVGTISTSGLYTAPSSAGSHVVTATSQADTSKSGSANVTVTTASTEITVSVTPSSTSLAVNQTQQFTASVQGTTNTAVTWAVDNVNGGNSTVGTISTSGFYTAPGATDTHTIKAISAADTTKSGTATATVTSAGSGGSGLAAPPGPGVLTYHNGNARSGQNLNETILTTSNVNSTQFGKLTSYAVDGYVYAQPLHVPNVSIPGQGTKNVVYVATEHDSVYAFDADGKTTTPLWKTSFINPAAGITTVSDSDFPQLYEEITPEIGITGTPVINPSTGVLYVVAKTKENGAFLQRLHALNITNGAEVAGSPVVINPSVPGGGDGGTTINFDPLIDNQRPGLLLSNGIVYVAFASHGDFGQFHGWLLGFDAHTLQQLFAFTPEPDLEGGGIWQSGGGPAADAGGYVYAITGNGGFDADSGGSDYGDSFLKFNSGGQVVDWFTPFNQDSLNLQDNDLGSGGPVLLPDQPGAHPHLIVSGGKEGRIYLLDRDNMGHYNASDDSQIVQSIANAVGPFFDTPAYWQSNVYFGSINDTLKTFQLSSGLLSTSPSSQSSAVFGFPGTTPSVSANGSTNGIVWALQVDAYESQGPAILHAYDATNLATELYNSNQNAARDNPGPAVKFTVPTIYNGKVYVGTQTQLSIFGLLNPGQ